MRFDLETVAPTRPGTSWLGSDPEWTSTDIRRQRALVFVVHHTGLHRVIQRRWTPTLDECVDADGSR